MSRAQSRSRPPTPTRRPRLERLERRATLSAPDGAAFAVDPPVGDPPPQDLAPTEATLDLAIAATEPADGSRPEAATEGIAVVFDRPLDPVGVGQGTINLERIGADGQGEYVYEPGSLAEELDASGTRLIVRLAAPLGPGRYRISLAGSAFVGALDGTFLFGDGADRALAEFEVAAPVEAQRPDPVPIPLTPGRIASVAGSLDLADDLDAVDLYRIELPAGHAWRLGLEVRSQRGGGALDAALALFDAEGRPLLTAELGRADAPRDPFLFAGLEPGVYFVGVSGAGNLPGLLGGYELARPGRGPADSGRAGGSYELDLVADPADEPTRLADFRLDRSDPQAGSPSGFALAFLGSIDVAGDREALDRAVEVVDAEGRIWPARAVAYDEVKATLTYLFESPLPAGRYTVRVAAVDGLTDLAGRPVVGVGREADRLATFPVFEPAGLPTAGELGLLLPAVAAAGVERSTTLAAGESASFRFVVPRRGFYTVAFRAGDQAIGVELYDRDGPVSFGNDPAADGRILADLGPGEYRLVIRAGDSGPAAIGFRISGSASQHDSFLLGGVGQGPALNLRVVAHTPFPRSPLVPDPEGPARSPLGRSDQPAAPPVAIATAPGLDRPEAPGAGAILPEAIATTGGASLIVAADADLIGRPSTDRGLVAPVGPGSIGGTALASTGLGGLGGALGFGQGEGQGIATGTSIRGGPDVRPPGVPPIDGGLAIPEATGDLPATAGRPGVVGRLREWAEGWLDGAESPPTAEPRAIAAGEPTADRVEAAPSTADPEAEAARAEADLADRLRGALPWGVGMLAGWIAIRRLRRRRRAAGRRAVAARIATPRPMGLGRVEAGRRERPVVRAVD